MHKRLIYTTFAHYFNIMKHLLSLFIVIYLGTGFIAKAQNTDKYHYYVDLTEVKDDKVKVVLKTPSINQSEIKFYLPKIVPGTYSIADYGRFITEFTAMDKKGKKLPVTKTEDNTWVISKANKLARISYWVDDSFDFEGEGPEIFWPAGTNIEDDNIVLNPSGFFGYFDGIKNIPFEFNVVRNPQYYGSTGLKLKGNPNKLSGSTKLVDGLTIKQEAVVDTYETENYDHLVDSPLMYAEADTAIIKVANTEVLISSYSPNKQITAKQIAQTLSETLTAQAAYLGGKLPVDKYAFIFHFTTLPIQSFGALEHSYSSFYFIPENNIYALEQTLRDFAAHEFFHIITPLTIHSQEIQNFDFNDPKMSKHLWLYEGVTEYFAGNVQVQNELIYPNQYIGMLREKLIVSQNFYDSVPFTEISKFTLDKYPDQYYNVYQKGALIGLCLDLQLLSLSDGEYNLRDLILDLSKRYGKEKAFNDDELFDVIGELTYPEIREFLRTYVEGPTPINYTEFFKLAGVSYQKEMEVETVTLGIDNNVLTLNPETGKLSIQNQDALGELGKALGFKDGDDLLKINDKEIPAIGPELQGFIGEIISGLAAGKEISYTVNRTDDSGETSEVRLAVENFNAKTIEQFIIQPDENATEKELMVQNAWLFGK